MGQVSKINIGGVDYDIRDKILEQFVEGIQPINNYGTINNAQDEEDITTDANNLLKFKDRAAVDGMGYVILRKNKTFASQVTKADTIYEIRYDFDLDGASVTIPSGCVLKFEGGNLTNGTIKFNLTKICGSAKFTQIDIASDSVFYDTEYIDACWFGVSPSNADNGAILNKLGLSELPLLLPSGRYNVTVPVELHNNIIKFIGDLLWAGSKDTMASMLTFKSLSYGNVEILGRIRVDNPNENDTPTINGICVDSCNNSTFHFSHVAYFNAGILLKNSSETGCSYNTFHLGNIWNHQYPIFFDNSVGWVNENLFIGGRLTRNSNFNAPYHIYANGREGVSIDNIKFIHTSIEGRLGPEAHVYLKNCQWWDFEDCRTEGSEHPYNLDGGCFNINITGIGYGAASATWNNEDNIYPISLVNNSVLHKIADFDATQDMFIYNSKAYLNKVGFIRQYGSATYNDIIQTTLQNAPSEEDAGWNWTGINKPCCRIKLNGHRVLMIQAKAKDVQTATLGFMIQYTKDNNDIFPSTEEAIKSIGAPRSYPISSDIVSIVTGKFEIRYYAFIPTSILRRFIFLPKNLNEIVIAITGKNSGFEIYTLENRQSLVLNTKVPNVYNTMTDNDTSIASLFGSPVLYNGQRWIDSDGFSANLKKGLTTQRPVLDASDAGFQYYDKTLGKWIVWNGTAYVNMDGSALS